MAAAKTLDWEHTTTLWTANFRSLHRIVRSEYSPDSMTLLEVRFISVSATSRHTSACHPSESKKWPLTTKSSAREGLHSQSLALVEAWNPNLLAVAIVASTAVAGGHAHVATACSPAELVAGGCHVAIGAGQSWGCRWLVMPLLERVLCELREGDTEAEYHKTAQMLPDVY